MPLAPRAPAPASLLACGALFALVLTTALPTPAQHAGHGHAPGAAPTHHDRIEGCLAEIDGVIAQGKGAGMAFPADQNRYPGPMHVLELRDRLGLTTDQERHVRALMDAMFAEAVPKSARLAEAERDLRRLFERGAADEASLRAAVATVERARAEVRSVHLLAHLRARDVLTAAQRETYHQARWPGR